VWHSAYLYSHAWCAHFAIFPILGMAPRVQCLAMMLSVFSACYAEEMGSCSDVSQEVAKASAMLQVHSKPHSFRGVEEIENPDVSKASCGTMFIDMNLHIEEARHCLPAGLVTKHLATIKTKVAGKRSKARHGNGDANNPYLDCHSSAQDSFGEPCNDGEPNCECMDSGYGTPPPTEAPDMPGPFPTGPTAAPTAATEAPKAPTSAPTAATEAPTSAPTAATAVPTAATEAPTSAPTAATEAPASEATAATEEPTAAAEEPTAATEACNWASVVPPPTVSTRLGAIRTSGVCEAAG